jgi:hypothetical protein
MPVKYPAGEVPGGTNVLGQPREHDAGFEPVTVPGYPTQLDGPARDRVSAAAGHAPPPQHDGKGLDRWKPHMESTSKQAAVARIITGHPRLSVSHRAGRSRSRTREARRRIL